MAGDVTQLLQRAREGDRLALDELIPVVYRELKDQAAHQLRHEQHHLTLQPTALVHEAYLRLLNNQRIQWQDRAHFFAVAAQMMRRILVDHARARGAAKRGHGATCVPLDDAAGEGEQERLIDILMLDDVLTRLAAIDSRQVQVVEMRVFAGFTVDETAAALGVSPRTVKADWQMARAWLSRELGPR
jgi:RNA polymerase sigma factor (TIGR02999 family)